MIHASNRTSFDVEGSSRPASSRTIRQFACAVSRALRKLSLLIVLLALLLPVSPPAAAAWLQPGQSGRLVEHNGRLVLAEASGQERIVNKQDADRIFGLNRSQWEAEARQMVDPGGGKVQLSPIETGTMVFDFQREPAVQAGGGLAVQPFFRDKQKPPDKIVVGSYYPAGTFPADFTERLKHNLEAGARSDLGPTYSVSISFKRNASLPPGIAAPHPGFFDVIEVIITHAAGHQGERKLPANHRYGPKTP